MKASPRHYILRFFGILGIFIAVYSLLQPLLLPHDPLCSRQNSIFACGATEDILKIPGFKYFNAAAGLFFFCLIAWSSFRLPRIELENTRLRRSLLLTANAALGYAIFLRALELFISSKICPWCMMLFVCVLGATLPVWVEWSRARFGRERTFLPGYFYSSMVKLTVVYVVVSFSSLCMFRGELPRPDRDTVQNALRAGFSGNFAQIRDQSAQTGVPYLLYIYQNGCAHCFRMSVALQDEAVQQLIGKIPRAILQSNRPEAEAMFQRYKFTGSPVLALFGAKEELLFSIDGFEGNRAFVDELDKLLGEHEDALGAPGQQHVHEGEAEHDHPH